MPAQEEIQGSPSDAGLLSTDSIDGSLFFKLDEVRYIAWPST